uniref:CCHC-type domain-containing protein n=1 Tax=Kryptolebias marmoratus TaxID=37003 RepID=A0A3Q3ARA5_KRYMA
NTVSRELTVENHGHFSRSGDLRERMPAGGSGRAGGGRGSGTLGSLGAIRGFVFYPGQPKACRKCGSNQHLSAECRSIFCKNCKTDKHLTKECPHPVSCNLCGEGGHTFRSCLNDEIKCQTVFDYLHNCGGDLFLLQECALTFRDDYLKFQNRWKYGQSFWSGDNLNRSTGVVVLFNNKTLQVE